MTPERIAEIRARVEAATPGPWVCGGPAQIAQTFDAEASIFPPDTWESHGFQYGGPIAVVSVSEEAEDWPLIAHARQDVPDLLDALAACQAELAAMRSAKESAQSDLEFALASVGAFRAAIEQIFSKAEPLESLEDGTIVTYRLVTGPLHRAIGMARGTDAGGKFLAELSAIRERAEALEAAIRVHRSAMAASLHPMMDGSERLRIKDLLAKPALAAAPPAPAADSLGETAVSVYDEIRAERERQKSGEYDERHDRRHGVNHLTFIAAQYARDSEHYGYTSRRRERIVQAAAILVAAIDLIDSESAAADSRADAAPAADGTGGQAR